MDRYDQIIEVLKNREKYDDRQRTFYKIRRDGVRRLGKEKWQSDTPVKLADPAIDKIKGQINRTIFQNDVICTFGTEQDNLAPYLKNAANCFSYRLKRKTNFNKSTKRSIDYMLESGISLIKIYRDVDENKVAFDDIRSSSFVVPPWTTDLQKADWCMEIKRVSLEAYKKNKLYNQHEDFIDSIKGDGSKNSKESEFSKLKYKREGLTHSDNLEEIIIWEVYYRDDAGNVRVVWWSPLRKDIPVRADQPLPYKHNKYPYAKFEQEIIDKSWNGSRGVVEKGMGEEVNATKYRNMWTDYMAFKAKPILTTQGTQVNITNELLKPGDVTKGGLSAVSFDPPPKELLQEMLNSRSLQQELVGSPDFALQQTLQSGDAQTARAVGAAQNNSSLVSEERIFSIRETLTEVFSQAWSLTCQFDGESLVYIFDGQTQILPQEAISDAYVIEPSGNPDGLGRAGEVQIVNDMFQNLRGDPRCNQDELYSMYYEVRGAETKKRLFVAGQDAAKREQLDQANCIDLMTNPVLEMQVDAEQGQDHATRVATNFQVMHKLFTERKAISPRAEGLLKQNTEQHIQLLQKQNPQLAKKLAFQFAEMEKSAVNQLKAEAAHLAGMEHGAMIRNGHAPAPQSEMAVAA
ncbi:MAG TPA: hypothetical protein VGN17_05145 [Bryobacteraceae bacterium]|jgi:hypothetical protein